MPHDRPVSHDVPVPPAPTLDPRPRRPAPAGPVGADLSALPPPFMPPYAVGPGGQGRVSGPGQRGTNGLAIAALCCGLAAVVPVAGVVAIVLGVVALHQLRQVRMRLGPAGPGHGDRRHRARHPRHARLGRAARARHHRRRERPSSRAPRPAPRPAPAGRPASSEIFVDDLEAGDCFSGGRTDQIDLVTPVPCTSAHESQVVTIFELPDGPYPGEDEVIAAAEEGCTDKADPLLTDAAYDDLEPSFIYPDSYTWRGDRTVLCLVEAPTGTTTGSALK